MHADRGAEEEHNPSHTGNLGGREGSVRLTAERQYGRTAQHWIAGTALASKAHAIVRRRNAAAATTTTRMSHMRSTVTGRGSACEHVVGHGRHGEAGGARCGRRGEHAAALSTVWHPILAYGCMHAVLAACQASRRRRALLMDAPRRADVGSMLSKGFAEGASLAGSAAWTAQCCLADFRRCHSQQPWPVAAARPCPLPPRLRLFAPHCTHILYSSARNVVSSWSAQCLPRGSPASKQNALLVHMFEGGQDRLGLAVPSECQGSVKARRGRRE